MLADRDLHVTDLFGLRNQGAHSGPPVGGAKALPVPTSILADVDGKVVWIDQSENYQRRSDPDYVLGALRKHLGWVIGRKSLQGSQRPRREFSRVRSRRRWNPGVCVPALDVSHASEPCQ
jgi:hypothetical protein